MLTTSASGLDPDISIAAAIRQAPRAAAARSIPEEKVQT
jgi:K+-transporting ATPase ATPase C chain